jgi:hypothetical protein
LKCAPRIEAARGPEVVVGDEIARRAERVAVAEVELGRGGDERIDIVIRTGGGHDDHGVETRAAVGAGALGEDLGAGAVDGLDGGGVAHPREVNLAETHGLDHAGVVARVEPADLDAEPCGEFF